ncbi:oxygen-sensing cyclic-di-GMP phosphodiesterase [Escherichia coli]|nr:oxygen-sensing cyclic-di-GMP phosphodiesterase [Escherichia coli]EET9403395.1 oxygen-sensing cyclic-di-GMP phosphodiesterase [Escherichia coli]EET9460391.1 oxygen-sensing cyclic-di-GMP phosphodiesterase [Escherichia coli]EEZ1235672.1 oxygen-sensing cyclic-di-GMP phosphodiesterase [Escherichia coli]EFI2516211.1 oxygen-sensing cyclic-di-GMP phosphodiesterase [Escherichia coli]
MEMYFKRMKDEWTGLVEQADPPIRAKAAEIAVAHAHYLSIEFYRIVRIDPHAEEFLSNEQVERQLKSAMERWIINVLSAQVDDVERLIQIQHTVAEVHARIGIPVEIVEMGFRVLKKILYPVIFSSDYSAIRQRDGAPAGILQIKTSSGAETSAFIERVADISQHMAALALEQEKSRQHIEQLIQFDPMTGLPNRNNLHNYLDDLIDKAVSPVVYLIGVDHIQDVIDSLGYAWADQALLEVVNRFREKLKPDQYLCRIEGTQFVLVSLENDVSNITQIADELRNVVSKPIMIDDKPFPLTLSIGISYDVGKNRDYLLSTAHNAMDYIRKNGGNGWQFFSPAMNEMVKERLVLGAALKEAISNNQLKLVYQPQIFAETGELYGIEALARWHDPLHGHVPPSRFIPLAEEIGEIENIGRWVIAEACRQLAEWRSQNIHIPALSVNLSALHFRSNQLPNQVSDAMHAWGIDGHQLTVEITESMMMEHDTEIFKRIQILRDMGVGLSVDDFGTGFSGLSRLVSLPVTEIKIDKSFVDRCLTEKRILALLEAITSIGQSLNLTVVAEGVETKEQFEMLRKIHCRVIQGYFFSRPLPAEEIPGWMSSVLPLKI